MLYIPKSLYDLQGSSRDIKGQSKSESYDQHGFFGTKFRGGQNFLIMVGGFYNEREYSGADWPVLLVMKKLLN